jgi:predicted nucleotidyltransferase component of viral defense system
MPPRRLIHHADELRELAERQQLPIDLVERDFVLVSIAALLVEDFPGQLCFKGGFVLRHVHGHLRLSGDVDTTRTAPPKHKLEAADVRRTIERAGRTLVRVRAKDPATDSARSLDFDRIDYTTDNGGKGRVAVEVSYREAVVLEPHEAMIGAPYYEPFAVPVLRPEEIVAEKLRALAQRSRPTDLSDLAWLLERVGAELDDALVAELVARKFVPGLVAPGDHQGRVLQQIDGFAGVYDDQVPALAPDAPAYSAASKLVKARLARFFS